VKGTRIKVKAESFVSGQQGLKIWPDSGIKVIEIPGIGVFCFY